MDIFKKIFKSIKKLFINKKEDLLLAEQAQDKETHDKNIIDALKTMVKKNKKNQVETLVNPGDGLGINNKMEY